MQSEWISISLDEQHLTLPTQVAVEVVVYCPSPPRPLTIKTSLAEGDELEDESALDNDDETITAADDEDEARSVSSEQSFGAWYRAYSSTSSMASSKSCDYYYQMDENDACPCTHSFPFDWNVEDYYSTKEKERYQKRYDKEDTYEMDICEQHINSVAPSAPEDDAETHGLLGKDLHSSPNDTMVLLAKDEKPETDGQAPATCADHGDHPRLLVSKQNEEIILESYGKMELLNESHWNTRCNYLSDFLNLERLKVSQNRINLLKLFSKLEVSDHLDLRQPSGVRVMSDQTDDEKPSCDFSSGTNKIEVAYFRRPYPASSPLSLGHVLNSPRALPHNANTSQASPLTE